MTSSLPWRRICSILYWRYLGLLMWNWTLHGSHYSCLLSLYFMLLSIASMEVTDQAHELPAILCVMCFHDTCLVQVNHGMFINWPPVLQGGEFGLIPAWRDLVLPIFNWTFHGSSCKIWHDLVVMSMLMQDLCYCLHWIWREKLLSCSVIHSR